MKLVLAHDYLVQMGGAERVVAAMSEAFPNAPIYTSACARDELWEVFRDRDIRTTWMQRLPGVTHHTHFKKYFPLYPWAFRAFGAIEAEAAWISSSTFAKYLRFAPGVRTVCYLHNTTRFLWQTGDYLDREVSSGFLNRAVRLALPLLREQDRAAAAGFTVLLANSENVRRRVRDFYGLEAEVLHPPVETSQFSISREDDGYYLVVSRLIGYKNIELPVRAFSQTGRRLVVLGEGPYLARLQSMAGPNVEFVGRASEAEVRTRYAKCLALIVPGEEDFGITPVEAMACGKPVVAFGRGGALETVVDGVTGVFFHEDSTEALLDAVARCEAGSWDPERIRRHAEGFAKEIFVEKTKRILFPQ